MNLLRVFLLLSLLTLMPGRLLALTETLTLSEGVTIKVLYFEPSQRTGYPRLALLISGGSSNEFMARAQFWLGKELVDRGWAIAVPIAPDSSGFGGLNARLLPELVGLLQTSHNLSPSKPLLVGISSGGSMALSIAARYPQVFSGVVATPGRLPEETEINSLQGLPIYLRIGEKDDFRWNRQLDSIVVKLGAAGGMVDAAIMPGAKHIFALDWENLEAWISALQQPE